MAFAEAIVKVVAEAIAKVIAWAVAGTVAKAVAGTVAKAVAGTVARAIAGTVAKADAKTVAKAVAGATAKALARTVAKADAKADAKTIAGEIARAAATVAATVAMHHSNWPERSHTLWPTHRFRARLPVQRQHGRRSVFVCLWAGSGGHADGTGRQGPAAPLELPRGVDDLQVPAVAAAGVQCRAMAGVLRRGPVSRLAEQASPPQVTEELSTESPSPASQVNQVRESPTQEQ